MNSCACRQMRDVVVVFALLCGGWVLADISNPPAGVFSGGSFDGWAQDFCLEAETLPGPNVSMSWGADQFFDQRAVSISAPPLTILESDDIDALGIEGGNTIRIAFPVGLDLRWGLGNLVLGGAGAAKVGTPVLSDDFTVIEIPVEIDFMPNETLVLSGLTMYGGYAARPLQGRLRLDYDGDTLWDKYDDYQMTLGMVQAGGAYDGWAYDLAELPLMLRERGTSVYLF